ncbi:hypothetical protein GCM10009799_32890 [Nocardiopsis rhodophaea]|uniref:Uncharacterized protein n=1 Tax=Nocardiopsis rhodophaea TaxID=280238 RepID=A0ABP5ENA6_9ACTN
MVDAEQELAGAGPDDTWDELLDLVGYNDARDCLIKGDLMACLWTVVGITPWGKQRPGVLAIRPGHTRRR